MTGHLTDGFHNLRIARLLVQRQLLPRPAIVYLDEVEPTTVKIEVRILLLMPIQAHTHAMRVLVPHRAAGITAGI